MDHSMERRAKVAPASGQRAAKRPAENPDAKSSEAKSPEDKSPEAKSPQATDPAVNDPASPDPKPATSGWPAVSQAALVTLAVLAILYTLFLARTLLLPITLALILNLVLKPLVRYLRRLQLPEPMGAAVILVITFSVIAILVQQLVGPATTWVQEGPRNLRQVEHRLRSLRAPIERITQASEQVDEITRLDQNNQRTMEVRVAQPPVTSAVFSLTGSILVGTFMAAVLLYFLLASGDRFLEKLVEVMPTWHNKRRAVQLVRDVQSGISRYLLSITLINTGLGFVIGLTMWLLGLPNPVLWGVMAGLLNFIPFLGAVTGATIVFLVALLSDSVAYPLAAPVLYLAINSLEGYLITPTLVGRAVSLHPVAIFLSLAVWTWMWGVGGTLLAVPLLVIAKLLCDHVEPLQPIARVLGR